MKIVVLTNSGPKAFSTGEGLIKDLLNSAEAFRLGIVNKIVSSIDLMPVVFDMADRMAAKAPIALRYAKEAACKGLDLSIEQGLRLEADLYFLFPNSNPKWH